MKITTPAFEHNEAIPEKYTCDGEDEHPELHISDVPNGTKSLALIIEDPDAPGGMFVHRVVWNIPPDTKKIVSGPTLKGVRGITDFGTTKYGGPCPPSGTHRYFFKVFALDSEIDLPEKATKRDLEDAMQGHEIEHVELIGLYNRQ